MLPVDVPANRSIWSRTLRSSACSSLAVITPRIPPPSHVSTLKIGSAMARSLRRSGDYAMPPEPRAKQMMAASLPSARRPLSATRPRASSNIPAGQPCPKPTRPCRIRGRNCCCPSSGCRSQWPGSIVELRLLRGQPDIALVVVQARPRRTGHPLRRRRQQLLPASAPSRCADRVRPPRSPAARAIRRRPRWRRAPCSAPRSPPTRGRWPAPAGCRRPAQVTGFSRQYCSIEPITAMPRI